MRTLKIRYAENAVWEFPVALSTSAFLLKIANFLQGFSVFTLFGLVVLLPYFELQTDARILIAKLLIAVVGIGIAAIFTAVLTGGMRYLTDPRLFVQILVFALLIISAYLLTGNSLRNTFGVGEMLYLGGVVIMALIGVYYVWAWLIDTEKEAARMPLLFQFPLLILAASALLFPNAALGRLTPLLVVLIPVALGFIAWGAERRIKVVAFLGIIISLFTLGKAAPALAFIVALFLSVSLGLWAIITILQHRSTSASLRADARAVIRGEVSLLTFFERQPAFLSVAAFIGSILVVVMVVTQMRPDIAQTIKALFDQYHGAFNSLNSAQRILIGSGAGAAPAATTWLTILTYNGLVGVAAYLLLFGSGLWLALVSVLGSAPSRFARVALQVFWAVPLLGLGIQIPLSVIVLWWSMLGALVALEILPNRIGRLDVSTNAPNWIKSLGQWAQIKLVLLVIMLIAWTYFVTLIIGQVK